MYFGWLFVLTGGYFGLIGNGDVSSSWAPTVVSSSGVDAASCVQYTSAPAAPADLMDASGAAAAFLSPPDADAAFQVVWIIEYCGACGFEF